VWWERLQQRWDFAKSSTFSLLQQRSPSAACFIAVMAAHTTR
jgi:hypothetical protein